MVKHQSVYGRVQDFFSDAAQKHVNALAVDNGFRRITYGELEAKAEKLGNLLGCLGVSKDSIVGIFTSDSIEVIAAILGILKAGGVFCPLDPSFPEKRLELMAQSVSPRWFVTEL